MSLRNANTAAIMDILAVNWTEQIPYVGSALIRAILDFSGITCSAQELGAKRTGRDGRANNVRILVRVPAGENHEQTFQNGSAVGNALINPLFKNRVDAILEQLSGIPSAILDLNVALNQGLVVQAPGLIEVAPTSGTVPMKLISVRSTAFHDILDIAPTTDMAIDDKATLNYTENGLITQEGVDFLHSSDTLITGVGGLTDPLIGAWKFSGKDVLSNLAGSPTLTEFSYALNSDPIPSGSLSKDGTPIASMDQTDIAQDVSSIARSVNLSLVQGRESLTIAQAAVNILTSQKRWARYVESEVAYKAFSSLERSVEVTNDTGSVISANTVLGRLQIQKNGISEVI
jgi:hypothetical protein